jgi:prolyl-tRNA synthetase
LYEVFAKNILAIPVLKARKPDYERFAGAEITWTIEGMMQDGKAVQMGTSHVLGQGFANALQMEFQDKDMQNKVPFLTSWGVTTRLIGTLIMVHGDQYGLVLPPLVAPILFIIVPIFKNDNDEKNKVLDIVEKFKSFFNCYSISFSVDERDEVSPGVKFFESEIKGIPFRIEIGVRDIEKEIFTLFERDLRLKKECLLSLLQTYELFYSFILKLQKDMQERIFKKAENFYNKRLFLKTKLSEFGPFLIKDNGFFITHWCCKDEDVFKEYQASVRCILETNVLNCECCLHDNCEEILNKILVAKSY